MKFSCVIFICPLVIASAIAMMQITHTTFKSCDPKQWIMTNTTLKWVNDTKLITCNITFKEEDNNNTIYRIHIIIDNCTNHVCTGEPTVWVEDINCDDAPNLSKSDLDVCQIANELTTSEEQKKSLIEKYGEWTGNKLYNLVLCISINDFHLSWNRTESK